jgi:hypothetical protein
MKTTIQRRVTVTQSSAMSQNYKENSPCQASKPSRNLGPIFCWYISCFLTQTDCCSLCPFLAVALYRIFAACAGSDVADPQILASKDFQFEYGVTFVFAYFLPLEWNRPRLKAFLTRSHVFSTLKMETIIVSETSVVHPGYTVRSESRCAFRLWYVNLVVGISGVPGGGWDFETARNSEYLTELNRIPSCVENISVTS